MYTIKHLMESFPQKISLSFISFIKESGRLHRIRDRYISCLYRIRL